MSRYTLSKTGYGFYRVTDNLTKKYWEFDSLHEGVAKSICREFNKLWEQVQRFEKYNYEHIEDKTRLEQRIDELEEELRLALN